MTNIEEIQNEAMRAVATANSREGHDFRTDYGSPIPFTGAAAESFFNELAARGASAVKALYSDMRICHPAANELKGVLISKGYRDARVLGCSVLIGNGDGEPIARCGEFTVCDKPFHSVVLVSGCLIDVTAGQFRKHKVSMPDYLVIPPDTTSEMLETNRRWVVKVDKVLIRQAQRTAAFNYSIAYIPTDRDCEWMKQLSHSHPA